MLKSDFKWFNFSNSSLSISFIFVCVILGYLTLTTYYGLFNIRISSFYSLDASGRTDSYSLLQSAKMLTGLAAPLCFNFLKLTNVKKTQFLVILNPIDAIPVFGKRF